MTDRLRSAPMPATLRAGRPPRHPAFAVRCPHCSAAEGARCTTRSGRHTKTGPCPARLADHATATAVCPTCQTAPGTPCHDNGIQRPDSSPVHNRRYEEAGDTAA
ncbi:zinc finger domain-containing protein [Streptomyces goshikiensis]|uniref:zinc finger domain-containing protein n=1 Tax=Streptomyces goshikiensis TaxID=1942 RepID=UPI003683BA3D